MSFVYVCDPSYGYTDGYRRLSISLYCRSSDSATSAPPPAFTASQRFRRRSSAAFCRPQARPPLRPPLASRWASFQHCTRCHGSVPGFSRHSCAAHACTAKSRAERSLQVFSHSPHAPAPRRPPAALASVDSLSSCAEHSSLAALFLCPMPPKKSKTVDLEPVDGLPVKMRQGGANQTDLIMFGIMSHRHKWYKLRQQSERGYELLPEEACGAQQRFP